MKHTKFLGINALVFLVILLGVIFAIDGTIANAQDNIVQTSKTDTLTIESIMQNNLGNIEITSCEYSYNTSIIRLARQSKYM